METLIQPVRVRPQPANAALRLPLYDGVERLLVVRDDRLGDLVLTLPALERLRAAYPGAILGLLVQPALAPLAGLFSPVDRVLTVGGELPATVATIRDFAPDAAVCISRRPAVAWALRRAGVRRVTGTGRRLFSLLFDRRVVVSRRRTRRHELEHALDFAVRAGAAPGPVRFPMELPEDARAGVDAWLRSRGIESDPIVIHPGSAGSCPSWPADRWRRLALELREAAHPLVLTRGPADRRAMDVFTGDGFAEFERGLPDLAALLARARLVLGNSTGPIHLAAALERPTLAIHAPWSSCGFERWGPYSERGRALVVGDAAGWSRRRRRRHATELMGRLDVAAVRRVVQTMLDEPRLDPVAPGCTL